LTLGSPTALFPRIASRQDGDVATIANRTSALSDAHRAALRSSLERPRFELIPLAGAIERAEALPTTVPTTVTASPSHGIEATIELCERLIARGHPTTPHLAAHMFRDGSHVREIADRCRAAGIREAFVIGGDARDRGELHDAIALLAALEECGHPFERIGIAGYPEGHPKIPADRLDASLLEKQPFASYLTTQMTFEADAITAWIRRIRAAGVTLPVYVGLPAPVELRRLLRIAARIGVGGSARYLRKNRQLLGFVLRRSFTPDRLLRSLAATIADPAANVAGLHLFTFNQVEAAADWRARMLDELS
jgi:methylenetetrahydrofolate reductase (NADPH)